MRAGEEGGEVGDVGDLKIPADDLVSAALESLNLMMSERKTWTIRRNLEVEI